MRACAGALVTVGVAFAPMVGVVADGPAARASVTSELTQAARKAQAYLKYMAFSRSGLIEQLVYEGFSRSVATRAVDQLHVDWNRQAERKGREYLKTFPMSQAELLEQLRYEGFTEAQVAYARRHIYPGSSPAPRPKPAPRPTDEDRITYSSTMDMCLDYSGDDVITLVTKGTSCGFGAGILRTYESKVPNGSVKAYGTVTFTAYSSVTRKRYAVKCGPQRYSRMADGARVRVVSCASGLNFRAKINGLYPTY